MNSKSAFAELRCATSGLQTVLLTLLHTRIAGQEASLLQDSAVLIALLQESAAQAVADRTSLTSNAAAVDADDDIALTLSNSELFSCSYFLFFKISTTGSIA